MADYYERQVFAAMNTPGLTLADGKFIENWVLNARLKDERHVKQNAMDRTARDRMKAKDVKERIDALQDDYVSIRKRAERNEVSWKDLTKARRGLARKRVELEQVYESLVSSQSSIEAMLEDPVGYLESFYSRFPALQDRRPNLAVDLDADRRKRGV